MEPASQRFRRLIEPIHDRAQAFARCLTRSRADGDDLYQEALVRALARIDALRDDDAFRSWLYRVIVNCHRNRCRRAFWRRFLPLGGAEPARTEAAEAVVGGAERARAALATLPAEQREAVVLFEIEGWQVDEIAALHGISASAVKSRLARGRERLRTYYVEADAADRAPSPSLAGGNP